MRYAIISDLHANLQATEAVLADLAAQKAERVICLGDAIGYGPQPAEVLSLVHAHVQEMIMGNHEAAAVGLMSTTDFSPGALASLAGTKRKLNRAAINYMAGLPYELETPAFRCSHSDFVDPKAFGYVETAEDAARSFAAREEPLLFVGHTHEPAVFELTPDGACAQRPVADFTLEFGHRYLVNPGSVGMPRTDDPRATYCIYDTQARRLTFHRTSYSVREFRRRIEADAQTGEQLAYVRSLLDDHALPVLQTRTNFSSVVAAPRPAARRPAPAAPPAPPPAPPRRRARAGVWITALVLLAAGGWAGWHHWAQKTRAAAARAKLSPAADKPADDQITAVRLVFDGRTNQIPFTLVSNTRGASAYFSNAKDLIARTCQVVYNLPATNLTWQQAEWVVRPEKSGQVTLQLGARWMASGRLYKMLYDDLVIEGAALTEGGFEGGDAARKAWGLTASTGKAQLAMEPGLARTGTACLSAGTRALAEQKIKVTAGQPVKLTFWYRAPPPPAK